MAPAYYMGLLLARQVLKMVKMDAEYEGAIRVSWIKEVKVRMG